MWKIRKKAFEMKVEASTMNIPALCKLRLGTNVPLSKTLRLGMFFEQLFANDPEQQKSFVERDVAKLHSLLMRERFPMAKLQYFLLMRESLPVAKLQSLLMRESLPVAELQSLLMRESLPAAEIDIASLVILLNTMNRNVQHSLDALASLYLGQLQENKIFLELLPVLVRQMLTVPNADELVLRDNLIDVQTAVVKLVCNSANDAILKQLIGSSKYFREFLEAAEHRYRQGPGTRRVEQDVVNKTRDEMIPQLQTMEERDRKYGDTKKELFSKFSAHESAGPSSDSAPKESDE